MFLRPLSLSVAECNKTNPPSAAELEAFAVKYSSPPYDYDTTCDMNLNQACVRVRVINSRYSVV